MRSRGLIALVALSVAACADGGGTPESPKTTSSGLQSAAEWCDLFASPLSALDAIEDPSELATELATYVARYGLLTEDLDVMGATSAGELKPSLAIVKAFYRSLLASAQSGELLDDAIAKADPSLEEVDPAARNIDEVVADACP